MANIFILPILLNAKEASAKRPNNSEVTVHFLHEDHIEGSRLLDTIHESHGKMIMQMEDGEIINGEILDLKDIVRWAIENGYLEQLRELNNGDTSPLSSEPQKRSS